MPHIVVEYSANLEPAVDIAKLIRDVHQAVLGTGVFELGAIRTRAERRDVFVVADGDPQNGFVHAALRVATGRTPEKRKAVAEAVMAILAAATAALRKDRGIGLSVEVEEIDPATAVRLNNLHDRMPAKGYAQDAAS
jgi:5-carboxymethyl-2-hydroxymuconate isomerase